MLISSQRTAQGPALDQTVLDAKIHGEFVEHCHVSPTDRAIVDSVVGIAHGLGKKAIAEYVSEPAILGVVREEGVDLAQGYHIGRPIDAVRFRRECVRRSD